jgi:aminoglycoside phosphotransferase (APT) family kinase protein
LLSQYAIKDTIVQPDFNTNNILINPDPKKLTFIDLGEIAITHPFFSLLNFLYQAIIHHGVEEGAQIYQKLQEACIENWLELGTKKQLLEGFILARKLWPIYSVIGRYHFMHCVDQEALKVYYANRPNQLIQAFREYIAS